MIGRQRFSLKVLRVFKDFKDLFPLRNYSFAEHS